LNPWSNRVKLIKGGVFSIYWFLWWSCFFCWWTLLLLIFGTPHKKKSQKKKFGKKNIPKYPRNCRKLVKKDQNIQDEGHIGKKKTQFEEGNSKLDI